MGKSDEKKRFYRKRTELFLLLDKMKLWPSSSGILHGIKDIEIKGDTALITTHCGETFRVRDSRKSRSARWLRNKWAVRACPKCKIPEWKLKKYSATTFADYGSDLRHK
ncbi:MAG: pyrrolysine--tRNA(Pyl) ligase small subunit [Eubacteriaceae bacterium]|nr:pyrrolysine--tRNA(Pyl) ligase small subunit [Eubacteriaceae bacterium]